MMIAERIGCCNAFGMVVIDDHCFLVFDDDCREQMEAGPIGPIFIEAREFVERDFVSLTQSEAEYWLCDTDSTSWRTYQWYVNDIPVSQDAAIEWYLQMVSRKGEEQ